MRLKAVLLAFFTAATFLACGDPGIDTGSNVPCHETAYRDTVACNGEPEMDEVRP